MKKALRYLLWVLIPVILLATCYVVSSSSLQKNTDSTPPKTPCIALTGERDYRIEVVTSPPDTAQPGDKLRIAFTGGYYDILPACELRGGQYYYNYPTVTELSDQSRTVVVYLDDQEVAAVECRYECSVEFSLPTDVDAGMHKIVVRPSSWLYTPREAEFEIEVKNKE